MTWLEVGLWAVAVAVGVVVGAVVTYVGVMLYYARGWYR